MDEEEETARKTEGAASEGGESGEHGVLKSGEKYDLHRHQVKN